MKNENPVFKIGDTVIVSNQGDLQYPKHGRIYTVLETLCDCIKLKEHPEWGYYTNPHFSLYRKSICKHSCCKDGDKKCEFYETA